MRDITDRARSHGGGLVDQIRTAPAPIAFEDQALSVPQLAACSRRRSPESEPKAPSHLEQGAKPMSRKERVKLWLRTLWAAIEVAEESSHGHLDRQIAALHDRVSAIEDDHRKGAGIENAVSGLDRPRGLDGRGFDFQQR